MSLHQFLFRFSPLVIFPYIITASIVSSYYIFLKFRLRREIKHLPYLQAVGVNFSNVLNQLRIKSTIYNFILFLSLLEIISNILLQTSIYVKFNYNTSDLKPVHVSNSCTLNDSDLIGLSEISTFLVYFTFRFSTNVWTMFPMILSVFFVVLRQLFINYPYRKLVRKYIIYIVIQFLVKTILSSFIRTYFFSQLLYTPFLVIDICIYISASHKFYNILKGNRNASSLHSPRDQYFQTQRMVKQFFYAQIFTLIIFFLMLIPAIANFISVPISIFAYNPCFLNYVSFGIIPDITIAKHIQDVLINLSPVFLAIEMICLFVVELLFLGLYLLLTVTILMSWIRRRIWNSQRTDLLTRCLMEDYRNSVYPYVQY